MKRHVVCSKHHFRDHRSFALKSQHVRANLARFLHSSLIKALSALDLANFSPAVITCEQKTSCSAAFSLLFPCFLSYRVNFRSIFIAKSLFCYRSLVSPRIPHRSEVFDLVSRSPWKIFTMCRAKSPRITRKNISTLESRVCGSKSTSRRLRI